jgi:hypothetical protein
MATAVGLGGTRRSGRRRGLLEVWVLRCTTLCLVLAGAMFALDVALQWSSALGEDGRVADRTPIYLEVAGARFTVPANMIRFETQRIGGRQDQVDLEILWPSFGGYDPVDRRAFDDISPESRSIFITIRPRLTDTDTAGRVAAIYRHYFAASGNADIEGLAGYRLDPTAGLGDEEVYIEAGSTRPFAVHCGAEDLADMPADCIREIHAGETLSVQIRFRRSLLDHWVDLDRGSRSLLASFGILS